MAFICDRLRGPQIVSKCLSITGLRLQSISLTVVFIFHLTDYKRMEWIVNKYQTFNSNESILSAQQFHDFGVSDVILVYEITRFRYSMLSFIVCSDLLFRENIFKHFYEKCYRISIMRYILCERRLVWVYQWLQSDKARVRADCLESGLESCWLALISKQCDRKRSKRVTSDVSIRVL